MKVLSQVKGVLRKTRGIIEKVGAVLSLSLFSVIAFAADPPPTGGGDDVSGIGNLAGLHTSINNNAGTIFKITVVIATLAGLILIVKGLVHLKQNYTGTGQEKHLSKGIASLTFGTALILAVPISHALVGTVGTQTTFETNAGTVTFSDVSAPT